MYPFAVLLEAFFSSLLTKTRVKYLVTYMNAHHWFMNKNDIRVLRAYGHCTYFPLNQHSLSQRDICQKYEDIARPGGWEENGHAEWDRSENGRFR